MVEFTCGFFGRTQGGSVASASPTLLWPPNGKMVAITVSGTVTPQANCSLPGTINYSAGPLAEKIGNLKAMRSSRPIPLAPSLP